MDGKVHKITSSVEKINSSHKTFTVTMLDTIQNPRSYYLMELQGFAHYGIVFITSFPRELFCWFIICRGLNSFLIITHCLY